MNREIWKPIFRGWYEVSNLGRVRRAKPGKSTRVGRICRLTPWGAGYLSVQIWIKGKCTLWNVHTLVAKAFLGPCPRGKEPNHKDLVKTNNRADNLEYMTRSQNIQHAYDNGALKPYKRTPEMIKRRNQTIQRRKKSGEIVLINGQWININKEKK